MTLMNKLLASAGMLAFSSGVAAAAPAMVQNDVNLRAGPGIDYEVITALPAGTTVNVMGCQASWCQVALGDTTGFASRAFLGLGGPVAAGPAYRGYGESYAYEGGVAPRYGGGPAYGESYGYQGERRLGDERGLRGERRFSEERSMRSARVSTEARSSSETRGSANTRGANARAGMTERRGGADANASATTGAAPRGGNSEDHGPNFIGPGKENVDNHH